MKPAFLNPPIYLELLNGNAYNFPVSLMEKDELGQWLPSSANIRIGYCWAESNTIIIAQNVNGRGKAAIKVGTPEHITSTYLKLYYSFDEMEFTLACKIPVRFSNGGNKELTSNTSKAKRNHPAAALDAQPDLSQLSNALNYVNQNYEIPYYWTLGP